MDTSLSSQSPESLSTSGSPPPTQPGATDEAVVRTPRSLTKEEKRAKLEEAKRRKEATTALRSPTKQPASPKSEGTAADVEPSVQASRPLDLLEALEGTKEGDTGMPPTASQERREALRRLNDKFNLEYFRRYELLIEFKNLQNPRHCPHGMYLVPSPESHFVWDGVFFIHEGIYAGAVFLFQILIPERYPYEIPRILFVSNVYHPLISEATRELSLTHAFPTWRPHHDHICHILTHIEQTFLDESILTNLNDASVPHPKALLVYKKNRGFFAEIAADCARKSADHVASVRGPIDGIFFDFTPLGETENRIAQREIYGDTNEYGDGGAGSPQIGVAGSNYWLQQLGKMVGLESSS